MEEASHPHVDSLIVNLLLGLPAWVGISQLPERQALGPLPASAQAPCCWRGHPKLLDVCSCQVFALAQMQRNMQERLVTGKQLIHSALTKFLLLLQLTRCRWLRAVEVPRAHRARERGVAPLIREDDALLFWTRLVE